MIKHEIIWTRTFSVTLPVSLGGQIVLPFALQILTLSLEYEIVQLRNVRACNFSTFFVLLLAIDQKITDTFI